MSCQRRRDEARRVRTCSGSLKLAVCRPHSRRSVPRWSTDASPRVRARCQAEVGKMQSRCAGLPCGWRSECVPALFGPPDSPRTPPTPISARQRPAPAREDLPDGAAGPGCVPYRVRVTLRGKKRVDRLTLQEADRVFAPPRRRSVDATLNASKKDGYGVAIPPPRFAVCLAPCAMAPES